jgi:hypothetical protein
MKDDTIAIKLKKKKRKRQRISAKVRRKIANKLMLQNCKRHNYRPFKI